jgi:hypothetical protein
LGPLTDPFKEAPESSLPVDNKEEEKSPSQKLVKFKFSTIEDSAPPYAGLYPFWLHLRLPLKQVPFLRMVQNREKKMRKSF